MPVYVCMLRAVNVGGHGKIKMDELRALFTSMKLRGAQTYVQSGNVVFQATERDTTLLVKRIQDGIEKRFRFRPDVFLRTCSELKGVISRNPFAKRRGIEPRKFLVYFLASRPGPEARKQLRMIKTEPEELVLGEKELYGYFPNGIARPKLSWSNVAKILKSPATGRNWNSVSKLLEMAETLESSR
jgi:uncharacterized protein (DUF1697 family)